MGGEIYETASEKLLKKGMKEGRAEGERDTLISLFTKGIITDEQASEQLGVSVDDFRGMIKKKQHRFATKAGRYSYQLFQ